ncbi:hypothetical protein BDGGKGIB_01577 [Nodularia sphaerocarpa UHCC 0038]|nr:hypothetical protein BDGGKGIB_01577 [Nodularia sphaerocarpa UHCC 0038]
MSNGYIRMVGYCKPSLLNGLLFLHLAVVTSTNLADEVQGHYLSFLPQTFAGDAHGSGADIENSAD